MSTDKELSVSIVGMCPAVTGDIALLINVAEIPVDPDSIESFVHQVTLSGDAFKGESKYAVQEWFTSIASWPDGSMFVAAMDGSVHGSVAGQWNRVVLAQAQAVNCVHAIGPGRAIAVDMAGNIHEVTLAGASQVFAGSGVRLNAIHGCSPDCAYAVGDEGQLLYFDGQAWLQSSLPTNANLLAVLCVAPDDVYVAGAHGCLFHWNGTVWSQADAQDVTISSLAMYKGSLFAAGGKSGILQLAGESLKQIKPVTIYRLSTSADRLFCAGSRFFAWHDGQSWKGGNYTLA
jgi:hypothetical protein